MASITKSTRNIIVAVTNEFLSSITETEDIELEFSNKDDSISNNIRLECKKSSKSPNVKRFLEYRNGTISIDATQ